MLDTADELDLLSLLKDLEIETNPWQDAVVESPARHVMMRAARRTGKSKTAAKRGMKKMLLPDTRTWIVGPSYDLAHKEFRYVREFCEKVSRLMDVPLPEPIRENPGSGDLYLMTSWGAEVIGKSAQKPETLVGEELDLLIMSEPALHKQDTWERYLRPTLTTRRGDSIWPYTPDAGGLWLYELELDAKTLPDWAVFTMAAWDCPHYDQDEIAAAKRELSEDAFYEQYGGEWRFYTGRVYRCVQPDVHYVEPFPIPQGWVLRCGTDFGLRDAFCNLWIAQAPTGEAYVVDEYYSAGQDCSTKEHVQALKAKEVAGRYHPQVRIADHHGLGGQLILDMSREGWKTIPCASNDRRARRDRTLNACTTKEGRSHPYHVREFGKPLGDVGSYPTLYFFKGKCPNLLREIKFYRWKDSTRPEGSMGATEGDDHAIDPLEYVCEYANLGVTARVKRNVRAGQSTYRPMHAVTGY